MLNYIVAYNQVEISFVLFEIKDIIAYKYCFCLFLLEK